MLRCQRVTAEGLATELNRALRDDGGGGDDFLAMPYHGKMTDAQRSDAQVRARTRSYTRTICVVMMALVFMLTPPLLPHALGFGAGLFFYVGSGTVLQYIYIYFCAAPYHLCNNFRAGRRFAV